jgi:putative Mn2+ efflux pump MntP
MERRGGTCRPPCEGSMDIIILSLLIGIGLAMDCFAVSLSAGAAYPADHLRIALAYALSFGAFQAGMCLFGWVLGVGFASFIAAYDHWIAFFLLLLEEGPPEAGRQALAALTVLSLAVATSIDALAVGISFAVLAIPPYLPAAIIGLVALCFSIVGVAFGKQLARIVGSRVDILGGVILILIGLRVLAEHLAMI